jgi:uncharacterized protein
MNIARGLALAVVWIATANPCLAQSFNCQYAKTPDEVVICQTPKLAEMDIKMSKLYFGYRGLISGPARRQMENDQRAWLQHRMSCGNNIGCIALAYRDRVAYLHQHTPVACEGPILTQPIGCDPGGSSEITDEDMAEFIGSGSNRVPIPEVETKGASILVPLGGENGTYVVPVKINRAITLRFVVDSGAADVSIPLDVFSTLVRTGTLQDEDLIGKKTYKLADGSTVSLPTFRIRSLILGSWEIENVTGSVAPVEGALLLGQSFLPDSSHGR